MTLQEELSDKKIPAICRYFLVVFINRAKLYNG